MPKKLTQEEFKERVFNCVGNKYSVISEYQGKTKPVTLFCNIHQIEFSATAECFMRGPENVRTICPQCFEEKQKERYAESRIELECAYCGKKFIRAKSKSLNSKSGLYLCCREHKDLAQQINSGAEFDIIRPSHYGTYDENAISVNAYRRNALDHLPHRCAVCGWNEDEDILQVHHIDENRQNNTLDNLIILCPNCHWKITLHKYKLIDKSYLQKIDT